MVPMMTGINAHIESVFNSLTKSEKKIASYVMEQPEKIIYTSITDLSNEADVGESTIIRFCRKLGFQSFQTFKLTLGQDIANATTSHLKELEIEIQDDDSLRDMMEKTLNINLCALHETLSLLDEKEVERAIEIMGNARKIFFCGAGVSEVTAKDAAYRFMRIGVDSFSLENHHFQRMQASLLSPEDVVVGISYSGTTRDVQDIFSIAKEEGIPIILITHEKNSLLTKDADIVLLHGSKQNLLQGGALSTKMCQLMIIDILYNGLFMKLGSTAADKKSKTLKAVFDRFL